MAKPISAVPQIFATATSPLPLANLDSDFAYVITKLNDLSTYSNYVVDTGTVNSLVLDYPAGVTLSSLLPGTMVQFKPANVNTGAVTLQIKIAGVDVGTATSVIDPQGNALASGMLKNTVIYSAIYSGSNWVLQGVVSSGLSLPPYPGNELKFLQVNGTATNVQWAAVPTVLPSIAGNSNKVLAVNLNETSAVWTRELRDLTLVISTGNICGKSITAHPTLQGQVGTFEAAFVGNNGGTVMISRTAAGSGFSALGELSFGVGGTTRASILSTEDASGDAAYLAFSTKNSSTVFAERARLTSSGDFSLQTVGTGFRVKEGSNAKQGTVALTSGAATVANSSVTANSRIFLTSQVDAGTPGFLRVSSRNPGVSFTITSSSNEDTSTVAYIIFEPA